MSVQTVRFRQNLGSARTTQDYSPNVWWDCPLDAIRNGTKPGYIFEPDIRNFKLAAAGAEAYNSHGLVAFGDTGLSTTVVDDEDGGISFSVDGDNESWAIGQNAFPFQISRSHYRLWFEAEIKFSTIADTQNGVFIGLIDAAALANAVPILTTGALADENLVGFHRLESDGDKLDTTYKANGVTAVTVGADAVTLTADTWVKVGMTYRPGIDPTIHDPNLSGGRKYLHRFYANNLALADYKQVPSTDGDDFPNDVRLGFVMAGMNAAAATPTASIRRLRIAQVWE